MTHGETCNRPVHWLPALAAAAVAVAGSVLSETAQAQTRASATAQLRQRLEQPVTVTWQGQELATALRRLAQTQRIDIWIDRRVDPSTPVELSASGQPLREILSATLTPHGWAASQYHGLVYIGPAQTTRELLTLSALAQRSLDRAAADVRAKWLRTQGWSFPRLSEPRDLVGELIKSVDAQLHGGQQIPHDLWPARALPPMTVLDRVVLLLAGFDRTCATSPDGRECRIVPIERPVRVARSYTVSAARAPAVSAVLKELQEAKATHRGTKLILAATVEEHDKVHAAIQGRSVEPSTSRRTASRPRGPDAQRFTLRIANQPVGPVIDQLARQLKLTIDWAAPDEARQTLISCEVREATLDELLTAILSTAGLTFTRDHDVVRIINAS